MNIKIIKFINKYQNEVKSMVFNGLMDTAKNHNSNVKLAIKNYLNRSLNEDLGSIYTHYNNNGVFYVALSEEDEVVGSLGAEYVDGNKFRLKRLSVKIGFRNNGIAKKLLHKVEKWVLEKNGTELILGTSEIQEKAFNFWTSNGFKLINTDISDTGIKLYSLNKVLKP
ncbi:MAG: GNAT family N-acetyltransferase [Chloroflexota bacterium]|jgi:GNAT superfamily N-acetyltransferase|nr:GNAT family N-acetyltransferase [Chloroflexota bacterium]MEE2620539.1 GNAT family N-acetyltransferase [Chloroflexota bacterium]|tara:strand:+ start:1838 stop:2341 length:504 start_codon:yes stop_codon:yes gene_type:complete